RVRARSPQRAAAHRARGEPLGRDEPAETLGELRARRLWTSLRQVLRRHLMPASLDPNLGLNYGWSTVRARKSLQACEDAAKRCYFARWTFMPALRYERMKHPRQLSSG